MGRGGLVFVCVLGCGSPPPTIADADLVDPDAMDASPGSSRLCASVEEVWLAYVADEAQDSQEQLFVARIGEAPLGPSMNASVDIQVREEETTFSWSADGRFLAYQEQRQPRSIYVVDLGGGQPGAPREASGPFLVDGSVGWIQWAPQGTKIAYTANQAYEMATEFWVIDVTSPPREFAQRLNAPLTYFPSYSPGDGPPFVWSPDGTKLLFRGDYEVQGRVDLFMVDVSGSTPGPPTRVNAGVGQVGLSFGWAPDGSAIAFFATDRMYVAPITGGAVGAPEMVLDVPIASYSFTREQEQLFVYTTGDEVWRIDLGGASLSPVLVSPGEANPRSASWAPGGDALILEGQTPEVRGSLDHVDLVTGVRTRVNAPLPVNAELRSWIWSPDGHAIAYRADQEVLDRTELYYVDLSGSPGPPIKVNTAPAHDFDVEPTIEWSPDGAGLAYIADQEIDEVRALFAVDIVDGVPSSPVRLNPPLTLGLPEMRGDVVVAHWSPDSTRVLYLADQDVDDTLEVYVVGADTPEQSSQVNGLLPLGQGDVLSARWGPCEPE